MMASALNATRPNPKSSFSIHIRIFWIIGLWYPDKDATLKWLYSLHSFVVLGLFYTSLLISQIVYMIQVWGDMEEMVAVLFLMVTIVGEYVKMYPFVCQPDAVKSVLNELDIEYFQASSNKEEQILRRCMYTVLRNFFLFTFACAVTCMIWGIYPVLDESSGSYTLPLKAWIPFDFKQSPQYQITYIYLAVGVCLSAIINALIDTYITGLIIHAGAQLDILAHRLENIKVQIAEDEMNSILLDINEKYFIERIVYCIKHHVAIMNYVHDIERLFSFASLSEFGAAGFVLVVTLFQLTLITPFTFRFVTLSTYMYCIFIALFLYCWYGNEIILKSKYICEAAYNSDWHICGCMKYRRMLLLLMVRAQRPVYVAAGKFIPLSIETYTTILRSCWSYFAMLRQVHEES